VLYVPTFTFVAARKVRHWALLRAADWRGAFVGSVRSPVG